MNMTESTLLDGCKSGVGLQDLMTGGLATEIDKRDYDYIAEVLRMNFKTFYTEDTVSADVRLDHTSARIKLNLHLGRYYLNLDGNPISFLTGQNVLGSTDIARSIQEYYKGVERAIQRKDPSFRMPPKVRQSVLDLNIYLHSIAFACYTSELNLTKLVQFKKMLGCIDHIYSFSVPDYEKDTLKEQLGIKIIRDGDYSIRFQKKMGSDSNGKYWTLALYNKSVEMKSGKKVPPDWTKDRIRFDLTLHNRWLHSNRLNILSKLNEKHGHDFKGWIHHVLASVLETIQLQRILTFTPLHKVDKGKFAREFSLWLTGKLSKQMISPACKSWFLAQGIDLTISHEVYGIATMSRATYGLSKELIAEVLHSGGKGLLGKQIESNVDGYPALMNRAHLILPDIGFDPIKRKLR